MDNLPTEVLERISCFLTRNSKFQCSLVCREWMSLLLPMLAPRVTSVTITLDHESCCLIGRFVNEDDARRQRPMKQKKDASATPNEMTSPNLHMSLAMCQCPHHIVRHLEILGLLFAELGPYIVDLVIDDCLVAPGVAMREDLFASIFDRLLHLERLTLHNLDLTYLSATALFKITEIRGLREICAEQCVNGGSGLIGSTRSRLDDAFWARLSLAENLTSVQVTGTDSVSDVTMYFLSSFCSRLWYVDVSGCKSVTAKGVSYFLLGGRRNQKRREAEMMYVRLGGTSFHPSMLERELHCNTAGGIASWVFSPVKLEIGHTACSVVNKQRPGTCLVLYI